MSELFIWQNENLNTLFYKEKWLERLSFDCILKLKNILPKVELI